VRSRIATSLVVLLAVVILVLLGAAIAGVNRDSAQTIGDIVLHL